MGLHRRTFLRRVAQGMGAIAIATGSKTLLTACAGNVDSTSGTSTTGTVSSKGLLNPGTLAWGLRRLVVLPTFFTTQLIPVS